MNSNIKHHRLTIKQLRHLYGVSHKTMVAWIVGVRGLGKPKFGKLGYSREQIAKIYNHLGMPENENTSK